MKDAVRGPSDWSIFLYFFRYLVPLWDKVLLVLLFSVILTLLDINTILLPLLVRKFIDQVLGQGDWRLLKILTFVIACQIVVFVSFSIFSEILKYVVSLRLAARLGRDVFKHVLRLPLSFFQKRPLGEHMYRVGTSFDPGFANLAIIGYFFELTGSTKSAQQPVVANDVDSVLGMMTQSTELLVRVVTRLALIIGTIALGFDRTVGVALLVFCVPYSLAIHWLYNYQRRIEGRYREKSQGFIAGLQEWFAGVKTIKAFGKSPSQYGRNIADYVRMLRVEWQNYFMKLVTDDFILGCRYAFIAGTLFYVCVSRKPTAGTIFGLYLLLDQFFGPLTLFIRIVEGIRIQLIPARRLMETLSARPTIIEKEKAVPLASFAGPYELQDVSFGYTPEREVLSGVTLRVEPGTRVGIVGPSGSGKSSLVNLLMRFYDPDAGRIIADAVDLKDLRMGAYYRNIGIVLQEDFLFGGSVLENIRYGKPGATDDEVAAAARLAAVHDDIMALPQGYDTDLAEGTRLSGGQRQRVAIARALIRDPSVLILDEATSALDSNTAHVIEETLSRVSRGKTVIMVTHKMASVRDFDMIYVIHQGRIQEKGTFSGLMSRGGMFASLYEQQMRGGNDRG